MKFDFLDARPIVIAIAGSNGAGKTTFYHSHLADTGLRFINADDLAHELKVGPYDAATIAAELRKALIEKRESFIFETVLSDPVGDKVGFLRDLVSRGDDVVLIFIQITNIESSIQRVSMRVAQGGHDVPDDKLQERFHRTRDNLRRAIDWLPHVLVYDNSDLAHPYRIVGHYQHGTQIE